MLLPKSLQRLREFEGKPTLANENRTHFRHKQWRGIRKKVIIQITAGGVAFMIWFLVCLSYMFGALYKSPSRHHALHVVAVDYDDGVIGQAVQAAYAELKGPGFFTLEFHSTEQYPTEADMYQAVWRGDYWGSIAITKDASERLSAALQGGEASASYDPAEALHYVWDQQYYTAFVNAGIKAHMLQLVAATRLAYNKINGTQASSIVDETDPNAIQVLLNPIQATETNIHPATFGTAVFLNTISMAMPVLQQFFFLLVLNGVLAAHSLYRKMTVLSSMRFRRISGIIFTFGASLCQAGYYWAFKEDWSVNGTQFVLTWMTIWLLMHIHLLVLDSISTIAPLPVMPFVVLLWVLLNITSAVCPLELQAGFFYWGIILPGNEAYSVLVTIWTGGAHNRLYRALPVLFAWWILTNVTTSLTHIRACHLAYKMDRDLGTANASEEDLEGAQTPEEKREEEEEQQIEPASRRNTMSRTTTKITRQRTMDQVSIGRREVYGPSIPPFLSRIGRTSTY
jgi:hypothetical protein